MITQLTTRVQMTHIIGICKQLFKVTTRHQLILHSESKKPWHDKFETTRPEKKTRFITTQTWQTETYDNHQTTSSSLLTVDTNDNCTICDLAILLNVLMFVTGKKHFSHLLSKTIQKANKKIYQHYNLSLSFNYFSTFHETLYDDEFTTLKSFLFYFFK